MNCGIWICYQYILFLKTAQFSLDGIGYAAMCQVVSVPQPRAFRLVKDRIMAPVDSIATVDISGDSKPIGCI